MKLKTTKDIKEYVESRIETIREKATKYNLLDRDESIRRALLIHKISELRLLLKIIEVRKR